LLELDAIQMTPFPEPRSVEPRAVAVRPRTKPHRVINDAAGVPRKAFFDPWATTAAIHMMGADLSDCGAAPGPVNVAVTFAPSGNVTSAVVEDALQGTPAGSCIAQHLRNTRAPEFDGENQTVRTTLTLK
jgi:hypothetical protein